MDAQALALLNFIPSFCPGCGGAVRPLDFLGRQDAFAGCSHSCRGCGLKWAYVRGPVLLEASRAGGSDLADYVSEAEV